jgi:hypothetical protein
VRDLYDDHCDERSSDGDGAPGGCNFGVRADRVVLVQ